MRRKGECFDHPLAERCFGRLKYERTDRRHDVTRQEARADMVDSRERFSNSKRLHSSLGDVSPHAYEVSAKVASCHVCIALTTTVSHGGPQAIPLGPLYPSSRAS